MKFTEKFKRKEKKLPKSEKQKRFVCSKCESELYLNMKYCDKCGGEVEWPNEYQKLIKNIFNSPHLSKK